MTTYCTVKKCAQCTSNGHCGYNQYCSNYKCVEKTPSVQKRKLKGASTSCRYNSDCMTEKCIPYNYRTCGKSKKYYFY